MALVLFTDSRGVSWRVWNIAPEVLKRSDYLGDEFRGGWLCFEAEGIGERRRLGNAPADWMTLSRARLEQLLDIATPVVRRPVRGRDSSADEAAGAP